MVAPVDLSHPVREHGVLIVLYLMNLAALRCPSLVISMVLPWQKLNMRYVFRRPGLWIIYVLLFSVPIARAIIFAEGTLNMEMLKMRHLKQS